MKVKCLPYKLGNNYKLMVNNNGNRLGYPMDKNAMHFLNLLGNKFFGIFFTYLLGQRLKDTLCSTKVLYKKDYEEINRFSHGWLLIKISAFAAKKIKFK